MTSGAERPQPGSACAVAVTPTTAAAENRTAVTILITLCPMRIPSLYRSQIERTYARLT
ncbi:hypothetical protein SVEN_2889 [Streptomyces venezuelae ATCC 10712]|uniref:Uncharacterized protein n=1 Tax=Streptomyces venezuelae (strain ATCC 10712 / CBS 650.69 / DSM 40230 / JCM 4526 / NBRC 13096 / PD 04745) TaxID=953739 RepID=F2R6C4_STRVP|nr:hypothetical protein SVEN_2889 [Streptomyces venezuelae ATCC 10712]